MMTPLDNSLFAICLFLSLSCLLKWTARRQVRELRLRNLAVAVMGSVAGNESGVARA
jgi:cation transporter-like permease